MNTSKQINAMIVLMSLLLVGVGFYTLWDPFRADHEVDHTKEAIVRRAGGTFASNCRECHGSNGEGAVGPALNPEIRAAQGLVDFTDAARRSEMQLLVKNTLTCGRIGTYMPAWSTEQGGALSDEKIRQLVIVLTENPGGNAWEHISEIIREEVAAGILQPARPVADVIAGSSINGATTSVCGQKPGGGAAAATPTPPAVASTWTVVATDNKFDINAIAVGANQSATVTFNNKGAATHNWHVLQVKDAQNRDIAVPQTTTQFLSGGQSGSVTFTVSQTGTYKYQCDLHPADMVGYLFVQ